MSESYRDKLRSIGFLSKGQSKPVVSETRSEDGRRTKAVTDETGTVTEHTAPGTGVSDRQDVLVTPEVVRLKAGFQQEG